MVKRRQYLEKLKSLKDLQIIKVVTGFRRCAEFTTIIRNILLQWTRLTQIMRVSGKSMIQIFF